MRGGGEVGDSIVVSEAILPCARRAGTEDNCKETAITSAGIVVCIFSLFLVYRDLSAIAFAGEELRVLTALQAISFASLVTLLASGGLVYLFARLGYIRRTAAFIPTPRDELEGVYASGSAVPSVCILIPS
jgi:hypothetical protein